MARIGTDIGYACDVLRSGGLVAIPTETVYGLAANALDANAVTRIFEAKNRPFFDPLIVHTSSAARIADYAASVPEWAKRLVEHFWPGPLTVVLPKKTQIPEIVTAGLETVALRVPNHSLTLEVLERLEFPLAAPSANPFGYVSPTTAVHVAEQLGDRVDYILDGGPCRVGVESTIVAGIDSRPTVLRLGGVPVEQIEAIVGQVALQSSAGALAMSPGSLASHYAPRKRVVLGVPHGVGPRAAFLAFTEFSSALPADHQRILSQSGDLREAARTVFAALRDLDALDVDTIYAELVPESGLGRAINDRLRRASAERRPE